MSQQVGPQVEAATAPCQCVFSSRAGSECVVLNPNSTVMSIDGISAYDQISRAHCGGEAIPFVRMFYPVAG